MKNKIRKADFGFDPILTSHASLKMNSRRIQPYEVAVVLSYGRRYYVRGAVIYALGHQEASICRKELRGQPIGRIEGLQVVCDPVSENVITVYRNNDFSSLRKRNTRNTISN